MTSGKKVIMVDGENNKWYDRAIFIVKDQKDGQPFGDNLVTEAEKIMNEYYTGKKSKKKERAGSKPPFQSLSLDAILNISITFFSLILLACIFFIVIPL